MSADFPEGLRLAVERVKADNPPPLNLTDHGISLRIFGQWLDEREQQGE